MGLYTRQQHDKHLEAIDAAEGCLAAAHPDLDTEYAGRLDAYLDDYTEISEMFWNRCPLTRKKLEQPGKDVQAIARMFHRLFIGCKISGMESRKYTGELERCRRKIKGKLFQTRMIMDANKNKSKCDDEENHKQPCSCGPLHLFQLSQMGDQNDVLR